MRTDVFTRKHKSLRAKLFETSDLIGRTDWTSDEEVKDLLARLHTLDADLLAHGKAEDERFMPFLRGKAPDLLARMDREHDADVAHRAALMHHAVDAARSAPGERAEAGLGFYRAFNRYVASYLEHLDEEETLVMPMLWATVPEPTLAEALQRFIVEVASKQSPADSAHIMAHNPPADRAELLRGVRARAPPAAFEALRALVEAQLTPAERERLARDLAAPEPRRASPTLR